MNENHLRFEVIWKGDEMFEMKVSANNGRFSGITEVYEQSESLIEFTNKLNGFPFTKERLKHSCGEKDSYSYFEMEFYLIEPNGKCGVLITIEENVPTEYRKEEKDILSMELIVEPHAIDVFCQELKSLAEKSDGTAKLKGIGNYGE